MDALYLSFAVVLFTAAPVAYGSSWARDWIGTAQPQQYWIRATSHGKAGSLTHWARPGIEPASSWKLVRFPPHHNRNSQFIFFKSLLSLFFGLLNFSYFYSSSLFLLSSPFCYWSFADFFQTVFSVLKFLSDTHFKNYLWSYRRGSVVKESD